MAAARDNNVCNNQNEKIWKKRKHNKKNKYDGSKSNWNSDTGKDEAMEVPLSKGEAMEVPLGTQEAWVSLMALYTTPAGDGWHVTENVENKFDWNKDSMVSYTYGFTAITEAVKLKEPWE